MNNVQSLRHTVWECKYHVVWSPKYRRKKLYGEIRRYLGDVIRDLAAQKECRVEQIGSCPRFAVDSSEVRCFSGGRIHQGKECDPHCKKLPGSTIEFYRAALLGTWLLGLHCWQG